MIPQSWRIIAGATILTMILGLMLYARAEHNRAETWQARSALEASNYRQTKAAYHRAQLAAHVAAEKARIAIEQRSAAIAKEIDNANDQTDYWRGLARRFADAGGMRAPGRTGAAGNASGTDGAAQADLAAGGDGSGTVTLSRADFDTMTGNTERLLRVHAWGERVISEGWARPPE